MRRRKRPGTVVVVMQGSAEGARVGQIITIGDPAREILRLAAARRADLLVLGAHQLGSKPGQRPGTTSFKVALTSATPVLLGK